MSNSQNEKKKPIGPPIRPVKESVPKGENIKLEKNVVNSTR
jgi:hypothetical protein